jgi:polyhydroxybutyrate depolymerase
MKGARRCRLAILAAALIAGACSSATADSGGSPTEGSPVPEMSTPSPSPLASLAPVAIVPGVESAGCKNGTSPGRRSETFRYDGIKRRYDIVVPKTQRGVAIPVVLGFHGYTDSSGALASRSGLAARAAADGFVGIFPRGSDVEGTTPHYFNIETVDDPSLADDVGFTTEILDRVEAELCIDRSRIFATGWSNGGMLAATLGCALSDRIAAVASVSGVHLLQDCRGRPMPIIVIHGSADDIVPFSEEDVAPAADVRGFIRSLHGNQAQVRMLAAVDLTPIESWVESWAERNGCELRDPAVESGIVVDKIAYRNCRAGGDVVLQVVKGGGHDWPPSPASDTTDEVLSFFASHPLPVDQLS